MTINNPIAFAFAAVIPVIVALYLLKLRRKKRVISSTFFWSQMVQDLQANVPFQKLRWNILLFLQLLIAIAIISSLVDFGIKGSLNEGQRTMFIVDTSAGMGAIDGDKTRLQKAVDQLRSYTSSLARREEVMIIEAGEQATVDLDFTSNLPAIQRTLDSLATHDTGSDMSTAFALAKSKAAEVDSPMIVVVSDFSGISPDLFKDSEYPVKFLQVGSPGRNIAITDFSVLWQSDDQSNATLNGFLVIRNFTDQAIDQEVEFLVDGNLVDVRSAQIDAGGKSGKLFRDIPYSPIEGAPGVLEARLKTTDDLAVDNTAYVVPSTNDEMSVLLVGDDPFLTLALSSLPGIRLYKMTQEEYKSEGNYDLTFFTGWAPETLPAGSYVFFKPPDREYLPCSVGADVQNPEVTDWDDGHPLLRFVNPGSFNIFTASKLEPRSGALSLIDGSNTSLMMYGERNYLRCLVFPFDLQGAGTDLMTRPTFPVLMFNIISFFRTYMNSSSIGLKTEGISAVRLDELGEKVKLTGPDGFDQEFPVDSGHVFLDVDKIGVYSMQVEGAPSAPKTIVANFFNEAESDITTSTEMLAATGGSGLQKFEVAAERRIWKWLSFLALAILAIEWVFYHRKGF